MKKIILLVLIASKLHGADAKLIDNIKQYFIMVHQKNMDNVIHQDDAKDSIEAKIIGHEILCRWDRESEQTPENKYSIVEVYLLESVELIYERKP